MFFFLRHVQMFPSSFPAFLYPLNHTMSRVSRSLSLNREIISNKAEDKHQLQQIIEHVSKQLTERINQRWDLNPVDKKQTSAQTTIDTKRRRRLDTVVGYTGIENGL